MASSNFLKKLRNRISKKKSYDIETPCSAGHGTILLRRYDRVPSTYGDSCNDRQNILRDFVPAVQKQQSPGSRFSGDVTLPRHFRLKSGHHRTQSNMTVMPDDDIDLYNAIGDHRRSSCSCTCTTPCKIISPITPSAPNGTLHLTPGSVHRSSSPVGKIRNAAKDPLPPIVKDAQKSEQEKEQERMKHEGKFDIAQEEIPRYTGIEDYSNVDFDPNAVTALPAATLRPRAHQVETTQQQHNLRGCMTLPPASAKVKKQAPSAPPFSHDIKGVPQVKRNTLVSEAPRVQPQLEGGSSLAPKQSLQPPAGKSQQQDRPKAVIEPEATQSSECQKQPQKRQTEPGELLDVIDCYYDSKKTVLQSSDLPITHESCISRKVPQPVLCEQAGHVVCHQSGPDHGVSMLSCSAPSRSTGIAHTTNSTEDARHYPPQNSGHHEYKEAHQVLRATSMGRIDSIDDLEVSLSVEDLYAHVPKGTVVKTPDTDDMEFYTSDPNTDNEDSLPPPPIPSRNYRSTDGCCSTAAQLGAGGCTCSHVKDMETGEELVEDGGDGEADSAVIHQQPRSVEVNGVKQVTEPIHMTLEEVWQDACARGIPMEKPSAMTLHRRHKSSSTSLVTANDKQDEEEDDGTTVSELNATDTVVVTASATASPTNAANKKKEKFKLKNIFKKTEQDSPSKSPTPGHRRTLSTPAETSAMEDVHNCSNAFDTSVEVISADLTSAEVSSSELSESFGTTSNCSSADSGVDDVTWSNAQSSESNCTINADFIDSLRKLKDCGWYWGPLSWDGAEARLANKTDGSFLVRDSSDDRYILSISFRSQGTTHHTRIEHYKGTFSFFSQPKSHGAGTIIEFIEKAMEHSRSGKFLYFLRPRAPGFPPAPVQLLYPVSRFRVMQSLQHICRFEILRSTRYDHIDELPLPQKVKGYLRESQYYTEYILEYEGGVFMQL